MGSRVATLVHRQNFEFPVGAAVGFEEIVGYNLFMGVRFALETIFSKILFNTLKLQLQHHENLRLLKEFSQSGVGASSLHDTFLTSCAKFINYCFPVIIYCLQYLLQRKKSCESLKPRKAKAAITSPMGSLLF